MTKELLESYRSKKEEIKELKYKLEHLRDGDAIIGNDTIFDYRSGYPIPQAVIGVDWNKIDRLEKRYKSKLEILEKDCEEVEIFIDEIQDSLTRRIFRLYYIDGMSQKNVGETIHLDRSRVSRKIDDFIKNAHKAQNAHL